MVTDALDALASFGPDAHPAHTFVQPLTDAPQEAVRNAARATLTALTDPQTPRSAEAKCTNGYGTQPPY